MGSATALLSSAASSLEKACCKRKCPPVSPSSSWAVPAQGAPWVKEGRCWDLPTLQDSIPARTVWE